MSMHPPIPTWSRQVIIPYLARRPDGSFVLVGPDAGAPVLTITTDGSISTGDPMTGTETAAMAQSGDSLGTVLLAMASEIARLRWELERVKSRTT